MSGKAPAAKHPRGVREGVARAWSVLALPIGVIVLSFLVGAVVILVSSILVSGSLDFGLPVRAYGGLVGGALGSWNGLVETIVSGAPLVLGGLAVGIGFKAGLFNIGVQGQYLMGAMAAAAVGAAVATQPAVVAIPAALVAGAIVGGAWGFVPGFLKARSGAHEVVTTIMLNYVALLTVSFLAFGPLRQPGATFGRTADVGNAALPVLIGRDGHLGILLAAVAVPLSLWFLYRAVIGFEIRTVGANPDAARYSGMRPRLLITLTMALCGMLGGLAGSIDILGITHYIVAGYATSVGFDSITVALLGRSHPVGILFAALLLGGMRAGAPQMQVQAGIPVEIVSVLQAIILFFLVANILVRKLLRIRAARPTGVEDLQTFTRTYGEGGVR
jgi:simple sugar transport system permease protein